jgi:hypothetical protein
VLDPKDVRDICLHISNLCKEEGCTEPSNICKKAVESIGSADEAKYLDLCAQSCMKCGEARTPAPKKSSYVA